MNPDTGEIRNFELKEFEKAIKGGWVDWNVDELVTIKNCAFRVKEVNIEEQTITLKAISKKMTKEAKS